MFGLGKKNEKDPKKALENADNVLNKGLSGFMTKTFMGKDFVNGMNETIAKAKDGVDMAEAYQKGDLPNGLPATAEVVSINDTGQLINFNPVVVMQLKVQPNSGAPFETTATAMVSKIAVPRIGDTNNIKYNPGDRTNIVVVQ